MDVAIGTSIGLVQVFAGHHKKLRFKQLYRGWTYPAVASVIYNATAFPIYRACLEEYNPYQAGFVAGVAVLPIDYSFSVGKIRRQRVRPQEFKGIVFNKNRILIHGSFI